MGEAIGVFAAMLSSTLGGVSVSVTRLLAGDAGPWLIGALRFGIGFLVLAPCALLWRQNWPRPRDWPGVAGLGLLFFGVFPVLFNASLARTTAAHGALALSTLPLLTMLVAAALGIERLTRRKTLGVLIAMGGVAAVLAVSLADGPPDMLHGDLLMVAAALCMAFYSVWSRPFIARSGTLTFTAWGMGVGAAALIAIAWIGGSATALRSFGSQQILAAGFLGIFGGTITFLLWAFALSRTTPTRVAVSVTINPIVAALMGTLLLHEPIRLNLIIGISAVLAGTWITATGAVSVKPAIASH